ncbi:MAG: DUF935 family protein [Myxococcales bacterium]|nr:DUF935 family protein [Myxococcales bacterium]
MVVAPGTHLSLVRPEPLPLEAPAGRTARVLPSDRYTDHPGHGLTPQKILQIFRLAECGFPSLQCDLIDDTVENDAHYRNLYEQREQAVAGKPWIIQAGAPGAREAEAAFALDRALRRLTMVETYQHQLSFNRYGWGASEIDWDVVALDGRRWVAPVWFATVPARRFRIDDQDQLRLLTKEEPVDGVALAPGKWWITKRTGGKLARVALSRTGTWLSLFKRNTTGDWYIYAQKFGLPLTLAFYDDNGGTDETSKTVAKKIVEDISEDGGAVVPKSIEVKFESADRNGDATGTHGGLISFCNRELSKLINGSTLSNDNGDSGGASYALGDVHDAVRWEQVLYDAERLQESFRVNVAVPFLRFNGMDDVAPPVLRVQVVRDLTPRQRADIAEIMIRNGLELSKSQLRQELGFREPIDETDRLIGSAPPAPAAGQGAA